MTSLYTHRDLSENEKFLAWSKRMLGTLECTLYNYKMTYVLPMLQDNILYIK